MDRSELTSALAKHRAWLQDEEGGERADLHYADLRDANLRDANLRYANLSGANLSGAQLWATIGNGREIKSLQIGQIGDIPGWPITYTTDVMQIGCQRHRIDEWRGFGDARISYMDSRALEWWRLARPVIFTAIDAMPAIPTSTAEQAAA